MRSLLFVPGHDERKLVKGLSCGADALIVDLEDAVPEAEKPRARGITSEFVKSHHTTLPLFIRINAFSTGLAQDDLAAVVGARPYGIVLPKCASSRDVKLLSIHLSALEAREGLPAGSIRILPIVTETAASVLATASYGENPNDRLIGLTWGGEDLAADIGATGNRGPDGRYAPLYELARSLTLLGATSAQVSAIDAVYTNFRDTPGLKLEAEQALRDGFTAKMAIHPDQIGPINEAFTPTTSDVEWAHRVIAAFQAAPTRGAIQLDGKMLDRPHLRSAQRVVARSAAANAN
ncbi:HpcH/HpaI aldolase/citrate lyase family protein [Ottowia thiooxydans]|uniref:HpcH/HpaI aldolase/citrate lyase family protein n=1 Tax=Ottowia thiooxydans TaxID=219182 RepID=UPI00040D0D59|nr:CoA ester lyase [Ottowia thiooxydans]